MQEWQEVYKDYRLICNPQKMSDGRFGAMLLIQKDLRSEMQEIKVGVKPDLYETEQEAANASRIAGRQWVDERG